MKKTILIADDEPNIINLIKLSLPSEYDIIEAKDGQEALDVISNKKPDLILLDVMMPKKNGYEVCKLLKAHDETKDIIIAMLSAKKEDQDIMTGLEIGADAYITKPFEPLELERRVQELLAMLE